MSVAEISRLIPKTPQTISQVVARLEKLGLIERRVRSGRGIGLHPTDDGAALAQQVTERDALVDDRLRKLIGTQRARELEHLLSQTLERIADAQP